MRRHLPQWRLLHQAGLCSSLILSIVKNGYRIPLLKPLHHRLTIPELPIPELHKPFIRDEIQSLLALGAVSIANSPPQVVTPIFAVPKKRPPGDTRPPFRLVHNLKALNKRLKPFPSSFRNPSVADLAQLLSPGETTFAVDVEAAYHHVEVHPESRGLLGFSFEETTYVWNVMPFGLSHSAHVWIMIAAAVTRSAQELPLAAAALSLDLQDPQPVPCLNYVDDVFGIGAQGALDALLRLFATLGITVSVKKVQLPSHITEWLGYLVMSLPNNPVRLGITSKRARNTRLLCRNFIRSCNNKTIVTKRSLARVLGKLGSLATLVRPTHLILRPLHAAMKAATRTSWDAAVPLTSDMANAIEEWLTVFRDVSLVALAPSRLPATLTTDAASLGGWGATLVIPSEDLQLSTAGSFSNTESLLHITALETLGVVRAVEHWRTLLQDRTLLLRSDATTVVHSLRRRTTRSKVVARLLANLHVRHLDPLNIHVIPTHLAGTLNLEADAASRLEYLRRDLHDYTIRNGVLSSLLLQVKDLLPDLPFVDRFASDVNHKFPLYNARRSVNPQIMDAMACPPGHWTEHLNYMFPPSSQPVLDRLMALLRDFPDIHGLLIVPRWPRATWWTTLHRLPGLKLVGRLPKESFQCGVSGSPGPANGRSTMLVFIV